MKRLVELWNITPQQCVALGDGNNDLEMLTYCGRGYAMDNALKNIKQIADYTCRSNNEDGLLVTLNHLFAEV